MKLYLMRHADANPKKKGQKDSERALTPKGKQQAKEAAKKIKESGTIPELIFSSPYLRARQTAEIAAKELGMGTAVYEEPPLACGCRINQLRQIISAHQEAGAILCVGHAPDFGIIAGELLGLPQARPLKKAEVIAVEI